MKKSDGIIYRYIDVCVIYLFLGKRHLIVNQNIWMKEIAQILAKEFKPQGIQNFSDFIVMQKKEL